MDILAETEIYLLVFEHFAHPQFFAVEADADAIETVDVVDERKEIYP